MAAKKTPPAATLHALLASPDELERFLLEHAGLPGPRANLELASAAADLLADARQRDTWLPRLQAWSALEPAEAPCNHPREFLPFVAWQALGALLLDLPSCNRDALVASLRKAASDPRWRTREAVAMAWQRVAARNFSLVQHAFSSWLAAPSELELRVMLVALAEPSLLSERERASFALSLADQVACTVSGWNAAAWNQGHRPALRKALEYAPSVFVAADPEQGFSMLERWADAEQVAWKKIVAANLRKARLARHFPDEVERVGERLAASFGV